MTETGLSIGTPHYMSPEQAMGDRELDARSDIYSLGAMLYEMLAGEPPYQGSTAQAIVAKVITEKAPPVTTHRDTVPGHVAAAVAKALSKLPADRFATASEFAKALTNPAFTLPSTVTGPAGAAAGSTAPAWRRVGWPVALAVVAAAAVWGWVRPEAPPVVSRYGLSLPPGQEMAEVFQSAMTFSPDGGSLVYLGPGDQLWAKRRDEFTAAPIAGTVGARGPEFSPDGNWIVFGVGTELRRIPAVGGSATVLTDSMEAQLIGATWLDDGTIAVVAAGWRLGRVPEVGGPLEILVDSVSASGGLAVGRPGALPGSPGVLFKLCDAGCQTRSELWVFEFASGQARMLLPGVAQAWWVPTGHLAYVRQDGAMFGVPFDLGALEVTGPPVPLLDGIRVAIGIVPAAAMSAAGDLVVSLGDGGQGLAGVEGVWLDRTGTATVIDPDWRVNLGGNWGFALSPDGTRLAVKAETDDGADIWIKELDRGPFSRLTFEASPELRPRWTPDGSSVMFLAARGDNQSVYVRNADGTGADSLLLDVGADVWEALYSRDGEWLLFREAGVAGATGMRDIKAIRPGVDSAPVPLLQAPYDEKVPALSPDGRWLAYESDQSGRNEVFVRPFPDVEGGQWQVSTTGGLSPVWAPSGEELFYIDGEQNMMAAQVQTDPTFSRGEQRVLFAINSSYLINGNYTSFDVHPDGERFLMMRIPIAESQDGTGQVVVAENWFEEVARKMRN
jgi:serine/threonine-protein kinase